LVEKGRRGNSLEKQSFDALSAFMGLITGDVIDGIVNVVVRSYERFKESQGMTLASSDNFLRSAYDDVGYFLVQSARALIDYGRHFYVSVGVIDSLRHTIVADRKSPHRRGHKPKAEPNLSPCA
jgi:hypothetical protein